MCTARGQAAGTGGSNSCYRCQSPSSTTRQAGPRRTVRPRGQSGPEVATTRSTDCRSRARSLPIPRSEPISTNSNRWGSMRATRPPATSETALRDDRSPPGPRGGRSKILALVVRNAIAENPCVGFAQPSLVTAMKLPIEVGWAIGAVPRSKSRANRRSAKPLMSADNCDR